MVSLERSVSCLSQLLASFVPPGKGLLITRHFDIEWRITACTHVQLILRAHPLAYGLYGADRRPREQVRFGLAGWLIRHLCWAFSA